jgi:hypothetical protein
VSRPRKVQKYRDDTKRRCERGLQLHCSFMETAAALIAYRERVVAESRYLCNAK